MAGKRTQRARGREIWARVERQHEVVSRPQLLGFGLTSSAIEHRLASGRLHRKWPGVYAVGRPHLSRHGVWMAAVLHCGDEAGLSHPSAGALWEIAPDRPGPIHVSVRVPADPGGEGLAVHRRATLHLVKRRGIPVTTPADTLVDLATMLSGEALEAAVNEADVRNLVSTEALRVHLGSIAPRAGVGILRALLDRHAFVLTHSALERLFLPIARRAGLSTPQSGVMVNGFEVDFFWPELGLVVETDGLRYHRTAAKQARDRLRDQVHTAAGLTCLRFTHAQVAQDPAHVERILRVTAERLARR